MIDETSYEIALRALECAVEDAVQHPEISNVKENRALAARAISLAKDSKRTTIDIKNRTRVVLILNRAVVRFLSNEMPSLSKYGEDLEALKVAALEDGVDECEKRLAFDILAYFSPAAREYCSEHNMPLLEPCDGCSLERIRQQCAASTQKIIKRSVAQEILAEGT